MTTFQSINMSLVSRERDRTSEATTPTTPRAPLISSPRPVQTQIMDESAPTTPTRHNFGGVRGQRPLPPSSYDNPAPPLQESSTQARHAGLTREHSHRSVQSSGSQDIDMEESEEEEDGSDGESIDGETGRPSKKKKGQRFFCTEYPPCNLSFTRSEHLARHIRKHTGERPFQCHCARKFSRLDNLRQHAQTVHVNEEIPGDSLAATGTRFQRQIRTDRVRPPGPRSRGSTASSQGSHGRGHSRNLSASSIGSNASTISRDDGRRRPPPLIMANESSPRSRLTIDTMRGHVSTGSYAYGTPSPGGPSTPTSTTYSNGPSSPFGSSLASPILTSARHVNLWTPRTPGRRLSVPSNANPFQSPHGTSYPSPYLSPLTSSNASNNSSNGSLFASPTSSNYSFSRQDPQATAEAEWRRRTWHPSTYSNYPRPATSGLSYFQTPDAPRPAFAPQAVTAMNFPQRLPGIETFDQITNRPKTPPRMGSNPMEVDLLSRPPLLPASSEQRVLGPNDRRGHASWDMSLHHNLTKLDIANGTPPKDAGLWSKQTIDEIHNAASSLSTVSQSLPPSQPFSAIAQIDSQKRPSESDHYPKPVTPQKNKRRGWYNGPLQVNQQAVHVQRTSPEDSSSSDGVPTPSATSVDYHPSIVHSNGYIEANHISTGHPAGFPGYTARNPQPGACATEASQAMKMTIPKDADMSGLEALVAAATSEEKAPSSSRH